MPVTEGMWDGYLPSDAATAINRERQATYGDPTPNMVALAQLWSVCFGVAVSPQQAAMGCVLLKCMREMQADYPEYKDNLEDICGFTNVLYKAKEQHGGVRPTEEDRPQQDAGGAERVGGEELPG